MRNHTKVEMDSRAVWWLHSIATAHELLLSIGGLVIELKQHEDGMHSWGGVDVCVCVRKRDGGVADMAASSCLLKLRSPCLSPLHALPNRAILVGP
jgi:hypothetical protein